MDSLTSKSTSFRPVGVPVSGRVMGDRGDRTLIFWDRCVHFNGVSFLKRWWTQGGIENGIGIQLPKIFKQVVPGIPIFILKINIYNDLIGSQNLGLGFRDFKIRVT